MKSAKVASFVLTLLCLYSNATQASDNIDIGFTKFKLENGLTVIVHEDHKSPIVTINIWYHVGSKDEKPGKTGFAHLFEHLMFNGSENHNDDYFIPLEKVGGSANGTTWFDRTNYYETVPSTAIDMALWLESDRMGHLLGVIDQAKLDEQRGVVQNEKRQYENQPYGKTDEIILKSIFPSGHPYSWSTIGSMEDLNAATVEDVHEWFNTHYGAANAVIVLAGNIDAATAKDKVQKYFGDIASGPPLVKREAWIAKRTENTRDIMFDRVPQTRLYVTWNAPAFGSQQNDQLDLVASLLGGGKNSRLYKTLVYDMQVATDITVSNESHELGSLFQIIIDVKPGADYREAERLLYVELDRFMKSGPTLAELQRVKIGYEVHWIRSLESIYKKSDVLATYETYLGDAGAYQATLDHYAKATPVQLQTIAKEWLSAGSYTLEVQPFPEYSVAAEGADRSKIPDTTTMPTLTFPELQRATLSNGLPVILAQRNSIPTIGMSMQFDAGNAADYGDKLGSASFTMAMLDEGTQQYNSLQFSEALENTGANFSAGCGLDTCTVSVNGLTRYIDSSLALYADALLHPEFPEKDLQRLRGQWLASIANDKSDPFGIAIRILPTLLYGSGHAYAIPFNGTGTESSINALTRKDLQAFHKKWLRPDNATLVVVGDISMKELLPKLEKSFATWKAPAHNKPTKNLAEVSESSSSRVFLIDKPDAEQSEIFAGQLIESTMTSDTIAINAMDNILGGAFTSRLNMNLREDKGWSYGAYTMLYNAIGQRPYLINAPVQTDKTIESIIEIRKEVNSYLGKKSPTEDELHTTVLDFTRSLPSRYETADAVQWAILDITRFNRPDNYIQTLSQKYEALTVKDIVDVARETLKPDQMTWVIVGDLDKIEKSIRALDMGEVVVLDVDGNKIR